MDATLTYVKRQCHVPIPNVLQEIFEFTERIRPSIPYPSPLALCGGAVRDMLLGLVPNDYDFCSRVDNYYVRELEKRGLITRTGPQNGLGNSFDYISSEGTIIKRIPVHIFNTRQEFGFAPQEFDFTINELALLPNGEIWAPYQTWFDLDNKIIRLNMIKQPSTNVCLRAVRFAARFNFTIEEETIEAIRSRMRERLDVHKACGQFIKIKKDGITDEQIGPLLEQINYPHRLSIDALIEHYEILIRKGEPHLDERDPGSAE